MKHKLFLVIVLIGCKTAMAQEFRAKITVNSSRINTSIEKKVFTTLQTQLNNFFNTRKWTNDAFKQNEKIECNFLLNLESQVEANTYKAQLVIQCARPAFGTSYNSALINYQDADVQFKYVEFQPIEFNENRVAGSDPNAANLTAIFAYYANMILGLTYDSYSPKGGEKYFMKAQNIVNNAPETNGITGWKPFDGLRNRYWLAENLTNPRNNILHSVLYGYYRTGLDNMITNEKDAVKNIVDALAQLKIFNQENPNSMFVQFFMQSRINELVGLIKRGSMDDKTRALEILQNLDAPNSAKYSEGIK